MERSSDHIDFANWQFDETFEEFNLADYAKKLLLRAADTVRNQFVDDIEDPSNAQLSISHAGSPILALLVADGDLVIRLDLGEVALCDLDSDDKERNKKLADSFRKLAQLIETI